MSALSYPLRAQEAGRPAKQPGCASEAGTQAHIDIAALAHEGRGFDVGSIHVGSVKHVLDAERHLHVAPEGAACPGARLPARIQIDDGERLAHIPQASASRHGGFGILFGLEPVIDIQAQQQARRRLSVAVQIELVGEGIGHVSARRAIRLPAKIGRASCRERV